MASQCEPFKTEILERVLKNKEKPSSVAKSLNLNTQAVLLFVKKYGWENKVDIINENYFSQIDTHAKAYLFGFLLGDGCITTMKNGKNMLTVTIHEQDRHILDFLSDELGLIHRRPTSPYKNNNVRKQHMVRLTLMNDQITSDLEKLGMIPRKSLTLGDFLPVVPEEFRDSAILGLFDADGCITMSKHLNKVGNPIRQYIQIRCTEDVAYGIVAHLGIDLYCLQKHDAIPNLVIGNKSLIFKFFQRCYKDSPIWLPRKKVKFEALFK